MLALGSQPRHAPEQKECLLDTLSRAQAHTGWPTRRLLAPLNLAPATYYRWKQRAAVGQLADRTVVPTHPVLLPTPQEIEAVCAFALSHPLTGYKRLSWQMLDEDVVCLRPHQVYRILQERDLLARRGPQPLPTLQRPPEPDHADQVWHTDLMYLYIRPRWYYLVDILDGYSRFLVHWFLNLTMTAETVTLTIQQALERLAHRQEGEPAGGSRSW